MEHKNLGEEKKNPSELVERALKTLENDFIVLGKTHIRAWHAWLVLGLMVGIMSGVLLVANRSGKFEGSKAAGSSPLALAAIPLPTNVLTKGTQVLNRFSAAAASDNDVSVSSAQFKISANGISFSSPLTLIIYGDANFSVLLASLSSPAPVASSSFVSIPLPESLFIPAGQTRYFELRGATNGGSSLATALQNLVIAAKTNGLPVQELKAQPSITVLSPNGGEQWQESPGITDTLSGYEKYRQDIKWSGAPDDFNTIYDGTVTAYLEQFVGGQYVTVGRIPPFAFGSIAWVVGVVGKQSCRGINGVDPDGCFNRSNMSLVPPGQYYVRVVNTKTGEGDRSDAPFTITAPSPSLNFSVDSTTVNSGGSAVFSKSASGVTKLALRTSCPSGVSAVNNELGELCNQTKNLSSTSQSIAVTFSNSHTIALPVSFFLAGYDDQGHLRVSKNLRMRIGGSHSYKPAAAGSATSTPSLPGGDAAAGGDGGGGDAGGGGL